MVEVPPKLQRQPEVRRHTEELLETKRRVGSDGPLPVDDLIGPRPRDTDSLREFGLCHAEGLEELLEDHLARVRRWAVRRDAPGRDDPRGVPPAPRHDTD